MTDRIQEIESQNSGHDIHEILEKFFFQRNSETVPLGKEWAETPEEDIEYVKARVWANDGKPTGIKDDAEFYAIQRTIYKKVIMIVKGELDYRAIASKVYNHLKTLPDGTELSTYEAVELTFGKPEAQYEDYRGCAYFYGGTVIRENDFLYIYHALMGKIAMGHKYEADFKKYEGACVGLPYNIPFVFKLKRK